MVSAKFHLKRSGILDERTEFPITETPVVFIHFIYYSKCLTLKKGLRMHQVHLSIEKISDPEWPKFPSGKGEMDEGKT